MKPKCFLLGLLWLSSLTLFAQVEPDSTEFGPVVSDSLISESASGIRLHANATLRFQSDASVYLRWESLPGTTNYKVWYKTSGNASWNSVVVGATELTLHNLPLDADFNWLVSSPEQVIPPTNLGQGFFSTRAQTEPILLSPDFFDQVSGWFEKETDDASFCDFLSASDAPLFEKLSFLQAYAYDNAPFIKSFTANSHMDWLPPAPTRAVGSCLPDFRGDCRCKVISRGSNLATPNENILHESGIIIPKSRQYIAKDPSDRTFVDRFEAGPAKFIALRQDEGTGGMSYEMSNIGRANDDDTTTTTHAAELFFFLACMKNGGWTTNLPDRCTCQRPVFLSYEYTTRQHIRAAKKSCPWSKGAAAQAEEMAFVSIYNTKTGDLTALDAGHAISGRGCNSSWNPQFWIEVVDVVAAAVGLYMATQDTTLGTFPKQLQISQLGTQVKELIGTPFSNKSGECGTVDQDFTLVTGANTLPLKPNEKIRVGLFSSYYVRTRGYGCYRAEAGMAGDYFIMGVVESELTDDDECCTEKFANYLLGSLSAPANADVKIEAVNSLDNRKQEVGFNLSSFGSWYGLPTSPSSGQILISKEFDLISGPSCSDGGERNTQKDIPDMNAEFSIWPNITEGQLFVNLNLPTDSEVFFLVHNKQGQCVQQSNIGTISKGAIQIPMDVSTLPSGLYFLTVKSDIQASTLKFIKS